VDINPEDIAKLISEYPDDEGFDVDKALGAYEERAQREHLDPDELVTLLRNLASRLVGVEGGKLTGSPPTPEELVRALRGAADHIEKTEEDAYWAERTRGDL
jgi:hypothetical protein